MLHVPVELILSRAFATAPESHWFRPLLVGPLAIVAALLSHTWIERPFQAWARRRGAVEVGSAQRP